MPSRPNILHLFTDQQRFDTIGALGNGLIQTPNLDRLVREGTAFTHAYSPSPECVPARCSMITGAYPGRTGCSSNARPMPPGMPTFMQHLTQAGYRTHGVGKCHFTPDANELRGFQTRVSQEEILQSRETDDYAQWLVKTGKEWIVEPHGVRGDMYYIPQPSPVPEDSHPTRWVTDRALDFLDSTQGEREPWYLYTSFIHPHPPFCPPIPWHKMYRAPQMPLPFLPENRGELLCFINHYQNRYKYRDRGLDLNLVRCIRAYYYACISFIDHEIGRLLNKLEETGQLENTLILFSSDHGEYLGDYGCFGKRGFHDVSSRIPLIVRWPGSERAGSQCSKPVSLIDLAPTLLETAGISCEDKVFDGFSLRALADGEISRDCVFSQYADGPNGLYMATNGRYKYAYSAPDHREYFFDLEQDPRETRNLALSQLKPESFNGLRSRCLAWVEAQGQSAALNESGWKNHPQRHLPENPDEGLIFQDPPWWKN